MACTDNKLRNSCDSKALSPLAKKVPQVAKGGPKTLLKARTFQRDALVRIVDQLSKYPEYILPMEAAMKSEDLLFTINKGGAVASTDWTGEYKTLQHLPLSFKLQYLKFKAEELKLDGFALDIFQKIQTVDPLEIHLLFSFDVQVHLSSWYPDGMSDAALATKLFSLRADEVGNRLGKLWEAGGLVVQGKVDYSKGGSFELEWPEKGDHASELTHCSGAKVVLPAHAQISKDFVLVDNHLDHYARVELRQTPPIVWYLHTFFASTAPFKNLMQTTGKKFKRLSELSLQVLATSELSFHEQVGKNLKEGADQAAKVNKTRATTKLQIAHSRLEANKEERKKRRTIKLS